MRNKVAKALRRGAEKNTVGLSKRVTRLRYKLFKKMYRKGKNFFIKEILEHKIS